jgi:hypothetical protein
MTRLFGLLIRFLSLLVLIAAWVGVLWFAIRIDISRFNLLSLIGLHALPPFAVWTSWLIWRRRSQQAKINAAEEAQKQAVAEQQAQQESARKAFEESLRNRQFALDCRWAEVRSDQPELVGADEVVPMSGADDGASPGERLLSSLTNTLSDLFSLCPGAQGLPIFVAESALFDRELAARSVAACCDAKNLPLVRVLPAADGVAEAIFSRFESDPHAPGALFLAVDGSSVVGDEDDDEFDTIESRHADALVVLLFTHPDYDLAFKELEAAPRQAREAVDPMTPFWERNRLQLQGLSERLARIPTDARMSLMELPILGQLRRPVAVAGKKAETAWRSAIEQALINADLKKLEFQSDQHDQVATVEVDAEDEIPCAWIVHNAGSYETSGDRLAALGSGLDAHGIELNIIRQATNVLAQVKLGVVDQWASVALAVTRAQALEAPTLWAAFGVRSAVGLVTQKI